MRTTQLGHLINPFSDCSDLRHGCVIKNQISSRTITVGEKEMYTFNDEIREKLSFKTITIEKYQLN